MTTRALQIESLLTPIIDYNTGAVAASYTVEFYSAGTSNAKSVWTEKEKTNAYTTRTLGTDGTVQVYGDGVYKIIIKNTGGTTIYTWDNVKCQATTYTVQNKSGAYTATPDDDLVIVDSSAGDVTISLQTVDNFERPLTVKNSGGGAGNTVTLDPNGAETIDGNSTYGLTGDKEAITIYPDTSGSTWRRNTKDEALYDILLGQFNRSDFSYKDADEIYIGSGSYAVDGKLVKITSTLTSPAIAAGSGTDWHYLYIDYSAVPSTGIIDNSDIYWDTAEPTWSDTKLGWYHGTATNDRCIFAVYTYTDDIKEFWHSGDYVCFEQIVTVQAATDYDTSFTASSAFRLPSFADMAEATIELDAAADATVTVAYWRPTGDSASTAGAYIAACYQDADTEFSHVIKPTRIIVGTGDTIDLRYGNAGDHTIGIKQHGWYLPRGL